MEGQGADVDTEQRVPAQYFDVPIVKVEGFMRSCGRGVDGRFVVRGICDEVGQSGSAGGRRMSDGSDGRRRSRV